MRDPLIKRIPRELVSDLGKYVALFLFMSIMIGFVSGFIVSDDSLKRTYDESFDKYEVEDGHFVLKEEGNEDLISELQNEGINVYPQFCKDETFQDMGANGNDDIVGDDVRLFAKREKVNRQELWEGRYPKTKSEILLDRLYSENNGVRTGDTVRIAGEDFIVVGTVALSDYSSMFRTNSQFMFDASNFTIGVVTDEGFDSVRNRGLAYEYVWRYKEHDLSDSERRDREEEVKDALIKYVYGDQDEVNMLDLFLGLTGVEKKNEVTDFVGRTENQAINFTGDDMGSDKVMIITLLYIVIAILAFIFGITAKSTIEQDSRAIGTLRASGYTRGELLRHYITLPIIVTLVAAIIGNILGYTILRDVTANTYLHSYSLLPYKVYWSGEAFMMTTLIPILIVVAVTLAVIYKELRIPPLMFLKGEIRRRIGGSVLSLRRGSFMTRFRSRVVLQNLPSYLVLAFGIWFSVFILMFCLGLTPLLEHFRGEVQSSQMAKFQYILKEEAATDSVAAEKYQMTSLVIDNDMDEEVAVYGIESGSKYLEDIKLPNKKNEILVSSAYAEKYKVKKGSELELEEEFEGKRHRFSVAGVYDYPASLAVFISLDQFNETFDNEEGAYIGYLSDEELTDISEDDIATVVTERDLTMIADQLEDSMGSMFGLFAVFGIAIFLIVIFLLSKIVIDRNRESISMVKILGYESGEISSLYNRPTMIVVIASLILSLPISYIAFKNIFGIMMLYYPGWLSIYLAPIVNVEIFVLGIISYAIMHFIAMRKIKKVSMAEALKDME